MILLVAVFGRLGNPLIAGFLVVESLGGYRIHRAPPGTFETFYSLVLETKGVNILGPLPVRFKAQVNDKASYPMGAPFFSESGNRACRKFQVRPRTQCGGGTMAMPSQPRGISSY